MKPNRKKEPKRAHIQFSWGLFQRYAEKLARIIREDKSIKSVYGIPRGGLFPAAMISEILDIPLILDKKKIKKNETLIIDEVSDTGKTLNNFNKANGKHKTAVIVLAPHSKHKPTYHVVEVSDWVRFPWEPKI